MQLTMRPLLVTTIMDVCHGVVKQLPIQLPALPNARIQHSRMVSTLSNALESAATAGVGFVHPQRDQRRTSARRVGRSG